MSSMEIMLVGGWKARCWEGSKVVWSEPYPFSRVGMEALCGIAVGIAVWVAINLGA